MLKIAIFPFYHDRLPVFASDCVFPMQTGCSSAVHKLGLLRDDIGDNISDLNGIYAELTGNYWVWKNYLSRHSDLEYVGFCHYRRFLDFEKPPVAGNFATKKSVFDFRREFRKKYCEHRIYDAIRGYDVILPGKLNMTSSGLSVRQQYLQDHPEEALDGMLRALREVFPEYVDDADQVMSDTAAYFCLNYVMRTGLFENWMAWVFTLLERASRYVAWNKYRATRYPKVPAYLIERFFNIWLRHCVRTTGARVLERDGVLVNSGTGKRILPGVWKWKLYDDRIFSIFNLAVYYRRTMKGIRYQGVGVGP